MVFKSINQLTSKANNMTNRIDIEPRFINIFYKNIIYKIVENKNLSIHHQISDLYKDEISKSMYFLERIYYNYLIENKKYLLINQNCDIINVDLFFNEIEINYNLILEWNIKNIVDIMIPILKVLIISLLIIIRIDTILISDSIQCKAFEDYYCLLLYIFIIIILSSMVYSSYYFMSHMISYICRELDGDIGEIMRIYGSIMSPC
jgi:hypothetical protein